MVVQPDLRNEGQALAFLLTPSFQGRKSIVSLVWLAFGHHLPDISPKVWVFHGAGSGAEALDIAIMTLPRGASDKTPTPMKGPQQRLQGLLQAGDLIVAGDSDH